MSQHLLYCGTSMIIMNTYYRMKQMPFEAKVNPESLINSLRDLYGNKITSAHIKAYCAQNDVGYQTVTKYLKPFKKGIGKWNLTVKEKLEANFAAPAIFAASPNTANLPFSDASVASFKAI